MTRLTNEGICLIDSLIFSVTPLGSHFPIHLLCKTWLRLLFWIERSFQWPLSLLACWSSGSFLRLPQVALRLKVTMMAATLRSCRSRPLLPILCTNPSGRNLKGCSVFFCSVLRRWTFAITPVSRGRPGCHEVCWFCSIGAFSTFCSVKAEGSKEESQSKTKGEAWSMEKLTATV